MDKRHPAERPAARLAGPPPMIGSTGKPGAPGQKPAFAPVKPTLAPAPAPARPVTASRPAASRPAPPAPPGPAAEEVVPLEFFPQLDAAVATLDEVDYFQLFKLPANSGIREIKSAYYRESRTYHPDRFAQLTEEPLKEKISSVFKRITEAYVVLRDDRKRNKYQADITGPDRAKKLRYTELSEVEQKAEAKKAVDELVGTTPKGRECFKNGMKEFDAKRFDKAMQQFKMAVMYEPANAKYKDKIKECDKEWEKVRPKDDFRIK
jgi:hypothetical protein